MPVEHECTISQQPCIANCNLVWAIYTKKTSVFTTNSILYRFLVTILLLVSHRVSCGFVNDDGFYLTEDLSDSETLQAVRCTGIFVEIDWFWNRRYLLLLCEKFHLQAESHRVSVRRCYRSTLPMSRYISVSYKWSNVQTNELLKFSIIVVQIRNQMAGKIVSSVAAAKITLLLPDVV